MIGKDGSEVVLCPCLQRVCSAPVLAPPGMAATGAGALHPTESSLRAQHIAFLIQELN